jgi:hypothetical protein
MNIDWLYIWQWILLNWKILLVLIIGGVVVLRLIFWLGRIAHFKWTARHLIHLQIALPRNDSKLDNEHRTEKDFREAIGKMEQLFRSLHETRDLNLYNILFRRILWHEPHFSFELQFEDRELNFVICCAPYYENIVMKQVTTFYPDADVAPLKPEKRFSLTKNGENANGYFFYTKKPFWFPINTYKKVEDDPLNGLSNSFAKLLPDEKACIQMIMHPHSEKWNKKAKSEGDALFKGKKHSQGLGIPLLGPILNILWLPIKILVKGFDPATDSISNAPGASSGDSYVRMLQSEEELYKSVGEKSLQSGFDTTIRVVASSPRHERVQEILNGLFVSFNIFKSKGGNRMENRRIIPIDSFNAPLILHNFKYRLPAFFEKKSLLCSEEMASIYHFPDARYNRIPTIHWLSYKILPPPLELPTEGVILGESVYRGESKFVRFKRNDRTRHQYIVGKSGSGKSVLLWNQAVQDIENGEGVCVVDPHGDLIDDIAACIPKHRAKDVIMFDPGDKERPMGLNILETKNAEERDRASLDAMEIFIKLFGNEIFGPRIQHYFRNACLSLMEDEDEGATLIDIPRMFIDDEFQKYKVAKVRNVVVRNFWENEMANTGDREKQEMIPYFTSKFGPFVTNTTMRNIIGQTKSAFDVRQIMDNQKVLLINLSKGKIGGINSQLLGLIVVSKINMAAMGRGEMPQDQRKDFYLYVDEFQNFASDTFATILSEARKYRLNLIMAHQYIAQLSEGAGGVAVGQKDSKIKDAVFGNVGTMMNFKVGAEDAEYFEKEYSPLLSAQDILSIANYKAYIKLNIDNTTSRPFSMSTLYDPTKKNAKVLEIMKKYSRMKYGRKREFVDQEIEARMGIDNISAIDEAAKNDATVNDNLLGDTPIPTENEESITANTTNLQAQVAKDQGAGNFAPEKIPEIVKKDVQMEALATPVESVQTQTPS